MEIVVFTRPSPSRRALHLGPVLAPLAVLLVAGLGIGVGGYAAMLAWQQGAPATVAASSAVSPSSATTREVVRAAAAAPAYDTAALARRMGALQAHVVRLDALSERLVQRLRLDPTEFDFSIPPPQGGPGPAADQPAASLASLVRELDDVQAYLDARSSSIEALQSLVSDRRHLAQLRPAGAPLAVGWTSSPFGWRRDPVQGTKTFHKGMDFAAAHGTPIYSVGAGVVTYSGVRSGYGNIVEVFHGDGLSSRYAHNQKNLVDIGERVEKGQEIALVGSTGRSVGPHVHFEIRRNGKAINPASFVSQIVETADRSIETANLGVKTANVGAKTAGK